jgi:hypothetical protein
MATTIKKATQLHNELKKLVAEIEEVSKQENLLNDDLTALADIYDIGRLLQRRLRDTIPAERRACRTPRELKEILKENPNLRIDENGNMSDEQIEFAENIAEIIYKVKDIMSDYLPETVNMSELKRASKVGEHLLPYVEKGIEIAEADINWSDRIITPAVLDVPTYKQELEAYQLIEGGEVALEEIEVGFNIMKHINSIQLRKDFRLQYGCIEELAEKGVPAAIAAYNQLKPAFEGHGKTNQDENEDGDNPCYMRLDLLKAKIDDYKKHLEHKNKSYSFHKLEEMEHIYKIRSENERLLQIEREHIELKGTITEKFGK